MQRLKDIVRVAAVVSLVIWIGLAGLYDLLRPMSNGCIMTYMYPTYIPISTPANVTSMKYALYLYHEGWQKIDFKEHLKKLSGVPVLFIPGNGGSYKQVRSLAAESYRAYQRGPLERLFYREASQIKGMDQEDVDISGIPLPSQYFYRLDLFTVDLEGEHSAMDGQILEEHTEYVVYAIHRILDQYKESHDAQVQEGATHSGELPRSVILVGHSVGGFVARAAVVHPHLRKSAVETVLTLSTPHQLPPLALQPSLGHYFAHVNQQWRKGYEVEASHSGLSDSPLSHVVVISISGGFHDYQVRSKLESLDGIIPCTHGFMISTTAMRNVWSAMEHPAILWCNQLVVQVSHALLSLIDGETGQTFPDVERRLAILTKMLDGGIPQNLDLPRQSQLSIKSNSTALQNGITDPGTQVYSMPSCPDSVHWTDGGLERDLFIQTTTVTILAMDGRRRWLDIHKLGSNGRDNFVFVTNLAPCSAVRIHLWPEKGTSSSVSVNKRVLEFTSRMIHIPSGPAPKQAEPGSQTEQAPPSGVFWLDSKDMHGFRFLTISVAPGPTVSGRPPPATSMGVGQFFNPQEGQRKFSPIFSLMSMYANKDMILAEDHPIALNLSFSISLGLLPVDLSIKTTGCGIEMSDFSPEKLDDTETSRLCKLRCFPPVALAWDTTSGIHILPNLYTKTIIVDSSPALWTSTQESEETVVFLLVDPHCSYKTSISVSAIAAAGRFLLLYFSQIMGLCIAVVFFALMQQAHAWELDRPIPSVLSAVQSNLRVPWPFLFLAVFPVLLAAVFFCLSSRPLPSVISFALVSLICYLFANGAMVILIAVSQLAFYVAATIHVFIKKWWQQEGSLFFLLLHPFVKFSSSFLAFKVVRIMRTNHLLVIALVTGILVCIVHPALGLFILLLSHGFCCHNALSSYRLASVRSYKRLEEFHKSGNDVDDDVLQFLWRNDGKIDKHFPPYDHSSSSPESARSFSETQLEIFHHRHGLLMLHLLAALSFVPSLLAWLQRISIRQSFPWLLDSVLCLGVLLHGVCDSQPEFNFFMFPVPGIWGKEIKLSAAYLLAGFFSYLSGLALAPYKAFYAMAIIGVISFAYRIVQRRNRVKGETYLRNRKHSHKH